MILHPSLTPALEAYRQQPPQAVLLAGERGVGLGTLARHLAEGGETLLVEPQLLTKASTIPQISVETVRTLYDETRTKASSPRVIIIDDADTMTHAAQNAFLKLLEEPNDYTRFVLTSHAPERLLPTVRSRVQTLAVVRITPEQSDELISQISTFSPQEKAQVTFIASGLPAEIARLGADPEYFRHMVAHTSLAKQLIEAKSGQAPAIILGQALDRAGALELVERMLYLLQRTPTEHTVKRIARLVDTHEYLQKGGNIKLQLLAAMV